MIIDGGGIGAGIAIGSKKDYFRVENCTIFNCEIGIRFMWACNGTLLNNNCSYNEIGVYLDGWTDILNPTQEIIQQCYCMNNTISNNTINYSEQEGIYMRNCDNTTIFANNLNYNHDGMFIEMHSDNNTIQDNFLKSNERFGFFFVHGSNNIITGNLMEHCGFYSDYHTFLYNNIDSTNLVNNGHLYFYINMTNLSENEFANAGQIYLANCNHSTIADLDMSDGCTSISLFECTDIRILYNNLSSNYYNGIYARDCNNMTIESNIINDNLHEGIYFSNGNYNLFLNNLFRNNGFRGGVRAFGFCCNNTFLNNKFNNNLEGLSFGLSCTDNNITENIFNGNLLSGITLEGGCEFNLIYSNFFRKNFKHCAQAVINNKWNNSEIGNYWDNYTGVDANGDGIGDSPHIISLSPLIQDYLPIVDSDPPIITIIKPTNNSKFGSSAPDFEINVNERFLDLMWYTLDGGLNNYTFTENGTIDQNAWNELPNGQIILRFYAIDKPGYMVFKEITIRKDVSSLDLLIIILSVVIPAIGIISVGIILLILRKRKLEKLS